MEPITYRAALDALTPPVIADIIGDLWGNSEAGDDMQDQMITEGIEALVANIGLADTLDLLEVEVPGLEVLDWVTL